MYLKRVEMRGFKSFADKTIVEFKEGVTCVVGPNGSGKSNITDAVRWVLGEQRVKTLRGNKMEDVIFSGTKHRKSLGLAEVKLTFDNSEQFFPLAYDEITIVRRVHRSGESEYLMNQMPCRLKDVRELFMDTGIGREGYSIIGQGRIDEILSNNKDERRLLFEEAAGIIKYKSRKQESERKLKATGDNLLRVQDILSEIEDRVEPLRLESERAKQYIDLTDALKNIELNYYAKRYLECEQGLLDLLEQMRQSEDQLNAIDSRQAELKTLYDEKDRDMFELNREIRQLEAEFHAYMNQESKTIGEIELINEKKLNAQMNIKRIEAEIEEIETEKQRLVALLNTQQEEKAAIDAAWSTGVEDVEKIEKELSEAQHALERIKLESDSDRREVIDALNQIEMRKQEVINLKRLCTTLDDKLTHISTLLAQQSSAIEQSSIDRESIVQNLELSLARQNTLNAKLSEAIRFSEHTKKQHSEAIKKYETTSVKLSEIETEHKLLKTLEDEYDGYDKGVKDILIKLENQNGIIGIVASLIEVPKKYETAIEVALGRAIQNIVCEEISDAKRSIDFLRKNDLGRVTFLPLDHLEDRGQQNDMLELMKKEKGYIGVAKDLIQMDQRYKKIADFLLGRILIVEDFETASRVVRLKNLKYKVITLNGDVLVPGGAITGGSFRSKVSNILGRKRRITELSDQIQHMREDKQKLARDMGQLMQTVTEQEAHIKDYRFELDGLRLEIVRFENARDNHEQMVESTKEIYEKYERDYQTLNAELEESQALIAEKDRFISEKTEWVKQVELSLTDVKSEMDVQSQNVQKLTEQVTSKRIERASLEQSLSFKSREVMRLQDDLEGFDSKVKMRMRQIEDYSDKEVVFDEEIVKLKSDLETLKETTATCKRTIDSKQSTKQSAYKVLDGYTKEITQLNGLHESSKEAIHKIDLKKVKLEVEKDTLTSELWEKYEMSMAEALQIEEVPYQKSEMKQLRYELKMLGSVNVNAIKEFDEVSTRYQFLTEQKKDLTDAVQQLEKIISDLEKKMIILFKEQFELINSYFKGTFKSLFNGGDAELLLADYDDLLECDIEIIAQPPGKKLQNINLLSGGEKALTAIALLFAILSTKPTPFCILDEIEAALDDVNVYRFADFIKAYAKNSQFVIITHRKGTMEVADTLYGVTMEEYGISKVLSVRMEDVAAQLD